ncbi:MAG: hypothetical protein NW237_06915 [Cyanobacteriota bacterium]|nr:hypothetical protein [Cyanobacteriota bacterium]
MGDGVCYQDPGSGKETLIRLEAERGFEGIPGASRSQQRSEMMRQILRRLDLVNAAWVRQEMAAIDQGIKERRSPPSWVQSAMGQAETLDQVETEDPQ